jgi:hypothetical protein
LVAQRRTELLLVPTDLSTDRLPEEPALEEIASKVQHPTLEWSIQQ